jgi:acetylornithine/N-succinyldiaminopimelate aminotransferase
MSKYDKYFIPVYKRTEISVKGGSGAFIEADDGMYLDMFSGLGVNVLGYGNKKVSKAIVDQAKKYTHISNYFEAEPAGKLAEYLVKNTFAEKVFFANSGTEAIEAGLKIVRKFGERTNRREIVAFTRSFHGRTLGSSSITAPDGSSYYNKGLEGVKVLEFNNIDHVSRITDHTAGVFIEMVQGQGGVNVADKEFIKVLKARTDKTGTIFFADEIQSGMGRTGKLFSFEHYGIEPDLCAIAKAIGGGLPLGALLAGKQFADCLTYGEHGSTFGGNPVSCAAGLATIKQVDRPLFLAQVQKKGALILSELSRLRKKYPSKLGRISGLGLMIGIEILLDEAKLPHAFLEKKILANMTQKNVLRLLPPLIIKEEEIMLFIDSFDQILKDQ